MRLRRKFKKTSEEKEESIKKLTIDEILVPYFRKPIDPLIEDIRKIDRNQMEEPEVEYISLNQ